MKKVILSLLGFAFLAGCAGYDYYKTNVRYRQVGNDCIYFYNEKGKEFNEDIDSLKDNKKVVYKNVKCEDLYLNDTFGYAERNDRKAIVPVYVEEKPVMSSCGHNTCTKKRFMKSKYTIIPAYAG